MRGFLQRHGAAAVEEDFEALLTRIRQRNYPETTAVLADCWMKAVSGGSYGRRNWEELNRLLDAAVDGRGLDTCTREILLGMKNWIRNMRTGSRPSRGVPEQLHPARASLNSEGISALIVRMLNEWMPVEVARLAVEANDWTMLEDDGRMIGIAIERLLVREHLSANTLEQLLDPKVVSAEWIYPAHLEILQDVVLSLLGRTRGPRPAVLPAALLCTSPNSQLPARYAEAVRGAFVTQRAGHEEIHIPITPIQPTQFMRNKPVRIASIILTTDGRWWQSEHLQCDDRICVVYRPGGRLRISYDADNAKVRVPLPDGRLRWSDRLYSADTLKFFGREWRVAKWEADDERTWLHLISSRVLPPSELLPTVRAGPWQLRPASVDMAWTALQAGISNSLVNRNSTSIDHLCRSDLIPIGHALLELADFVANRRLRTVETLESHLKSLSILEKPLIPVYGRVPWRILPKAVCSALLRLRSTPEVSRLLDELFVEFPETFKHSA
jgi:hypothetical protein